MQEAALREWLQHDKKGTLEIITGLGKTFIALKAILTMPEQCNILILAETQLRENTINEDADKFEKLYNIHPFTNKNVVFMCYQSAYKYSLEDVFNNDLPTLVICDEIHEMLTPVYFRFAKYNLINKDLAILGLSATIDRKTKYYYEDGTEYKKPDLLNQFAPVCYTYGVNQGQEDQTARQLKIYIINHKLNEFNRNIEAGATGNKFMTTEKKNYDYLDQQFRKSLFIPVSNKSREFMIRNAASR